MAEQSKTFCILPFIHSHASVSGHWKPCCNSFYINTDKHYFDKDGYTHNSWFTSERMNELRKNLLNGVEDSMCDICWKAEKLSGESLRTTYLRNNRFRDYQNNDDIVKNPQIKYLDLKLSNECNLKCRMCDYTSSHKILEDMEAIEKDKTLTLPDNYSRSPSHEKFIDSRGIKQMPDHVFDELVNDILPNLELLKITGGEPLVQQQVLKLFDICIDKGYAKNIKLNITTNATKFTKKFLTRLNDFKSVHFDVSCDGFGTVYDYIRYPFNWNKFVKRIDSIIESNMSYSIATVPQMYNVENLPKLQDWNSKVQPNSGNPVFLNTLLRPESNYNSLRYVPIHILEDVHKKIKKNKSSDVLISRLEKLIDKNYQPTKEENIRILNSVKSLDKVRNQNFKDYLEPMTTEWLEGLFKKYA